MLWLAMSYNIPIRPSKIRVYVWRKLREMGAGYFKQGVAILPHTKENLIQVRALAAKIRELGGEAALVELRFLDEIDEVRQILAFKKQSENEFRALLLDFAKLYEEAQGCFSSSREERERIRRRYTKVKSRDFFNIEEDLDLEGASRELLAGFKKSTQDLCQLMARFFAE